jgi:hypothetical protein
MKLTKPAYWEWIFNVSSPHSPKDWPPIYVTAKQRTPKIDDWDTTRIQTLLRLTEDGMLWVRGLTDLDHDVSQSQLRAFKTIEGETLPREVTMRDTLIQTIGTLDYFDLDYDMFHCTLCSGVVDVR